MASISQHRKASGCLDALAIGQGVEALRQRLQQVYPSFQESPSVFAQRMRSYEKRVSQWRKRAQSSFCRREGLAKAIGRSLLAAGNCEVLDAMAGCGKDSLLMAGMGCEVWCVEKSFFLAALLAFARAQWWPLAWRQCTQILWTDMMCLEANQSRADVVYLDPLFPIGSIKATGMPTLSTQWVRHFGHPTAPQQEPLLLEKALNLARKKVIVKRPNRHYAALAGQKPAYTLSAGMINFDIYLP